MSASIPTAYRHDEEPALASHAAGWNGSRRPLGAADHDGEGVVVIGNRPYVDLAPTREAVMT